MRSLILLLLLVHWDGPHNAAIEGITNSKGDYCCDLTEGYRADNWGTIDNKFWVEIGGRHYDVPPGNVVSSPVRIDHAIVWLYWDWVNGQPVIKCFLPGPES